MYIRMYVCTSGRFRGGSLGSDTPPGNPGSAPVYGWNSGTIEKTPQ